MNNTLLLLLVIVTVGLVLYALAQPPTVVETEHYVWAERGALVIPGFILGIPTSQIEFQAVRVRKVDVLVKHGPLLDNLEFWFDQRKDMVLLLTVEHTDGKSGAVILAVQERLKAYAANILEYVGLGPPERAHTVASSGYHIFVFYGAESS